MAHAVECVTLATCLMASACGSTSLVGLTDDGTTVDSPVDGVEADPGVDARDSGEEPAEEPALIPAGDPEYHEFPDTGRYTEFGQQIPVAFSGSVYEIIVGGSPHDELGVYRLLPGGTSLETAWFDADLIVAPKGTICWSGEAFIAALPIHSEGIMIFAFDEDADLVNGPEMIAFEEDLREETSFVTCPDTGPVFVASTAHTWPDGIPRRLYSIEADGTPTGDWSDSGFPMDSFHPENGDPLRLEWGDEFVVVSGFPETPVLVYVSHDGSYRESDPFPPASVIVDGNCCGLALTESGMAVTWIQGRMDDPKRHLVLSRLSSDGEVLLDPVITTAIVDDYTYHGIEMASSGSTILVSAGTEQGLDYTYPRLYLFDLRGDQLAPSILPDPAWNEDDPSFSYGPTHTALFWEGDSYSSIWQESRYIGYASFELRGIEE